MPGRRLVAGPLAALAMLGWGCAQLIGADFDKPFASTATTTSGGGHGGGATGAGGDASATSTGTTVSATSTTSAGGAGGAGTGGSATTTASSSSGGPICGDGNMDPGEQCDDGNQTTGDGCSAFCTLEASEACPGTLIPLGPSTVTIQGTLDLHLDDLAPTCGPTLKPDVAYAVQPSVSGTLTATLLDGLGKSISIRTTCPGGAPLHTELGCKTGAGPEALTIWVQAGQTYHVIVDGDGAAYQLQLDLTECGDGVVQGLEQCEGAGCAGCVSCTGPGEAKDPASKHCYVVGHAKSWSEARAACVAWGGDLAGIRSKAELDYLTLTMGLGSVPVWIGGDDASQACVYSWVNGEPWWPSFAANEPSQAAGEHCLALDPMGGYQMSDQGCDVMADYLCERAPAGPCGDGIVQPGEGCDDANASNTDRCSKECVIKCLVGEIQDPATEHCYLLGGASSTQAGAVAFCGVDSHLATIGSLEENDFVKQMIVGHDAWLGGSWLLPPGTLMWIDTTPTCAYLNWVPGEPSMIPAGESCVEMHNASGQWDNVDCGISLRAICEHDP